MSYGSNERWDPLKRDLGMYESTLRALEYFLSLGMNGFKFNRHRPRRMFRLARYYHSQ
jgi:hypothetical protein